MGTTTSPVTDPGEEDILAAAGVQRVPAPSAPGMSQEQLVIPGAGELPPAETAGRIAGLAGRGAAQVATALPQSAYDVGVALPWNVGAGAYNLATGGKAPYAPWGGQVTDEMLDAAARKLGTSPLPYPETTPEMIGYGAGVGAAGGTSGPLYAKVLRAGQNLPVVGPLLQRGADWIGAQPVRQAVAGGVAGGASGTLAAAGFNPYVQALGALGAGALTGMVPGATSGFVSEADRALLNRARAPQNEGGFEIPIATAQAAPATRWAFSATKDFPLSGGEKFAANQRDAYNAAVGRSFGADATKLTPAVFEDAKDNLGQGFSNIAKNADTPISNDSLDRLADLHQRATDLGSDGKDVANRIDSLLGQTKDGVLSGDWLANELKMKSATSTGMKAVGQAQPYWAELKENLYDILKDNPNIDPDQYAALRNQYRNLKVVEGNTDLQGNVQPGRFGAAANRNQRFPGYDPDLSTLATIGTNYIKEPPQSGTAPRGVVYDLMKEAAKAAPWAIGIGGAEAFSPEAALGVAGTMGGGAAAQRVMQMGARSQLPDISYPAYVGRTWATTPAQPGRNAPGITQPPTVGAETMSPWWRQQMARALMQPPPPVYGGQ